MNYHNITHDDMSNGDGLRVVLWVAGCSHGCPGCQNPVTWDPSDGEPFTFGQMKEIMQELAKPHISGMTISGGDPFHPNNRSTVFSIVEFVRDYRPKPTIWIYTGYTWEQVIRDPLLFRILSQIDVLVEGPFIERLKDVNYPWAGSTNQRVVDVRKTLEKGEIVLYESH